jgi:hypothetical protein
MRFFNTIFALFLLLATQLVVAQNGRADALALSVRGAPTPDSLSKLLTVGLTSDQEKVRSIFRWITANISYQHRRVNRSGAPRHPADLDTTWDGKPADERTAFSVMQKREAVCEGYARLFKTLCNAAGVRSVVITGYARNEQDPADRNFYPNHSWNAVWLDSAWQLLDATWASGYMRSGSDLFTQAFDEYYFCTPPEQFVRNHLPEDLNWTLLARPKLLQEFRYAPFRTQAALKYRVERITPSNGILTPAVGDTLRFRVELRANFEDGPIAAGLAPDVLPGQVLLGEDFAEPLKPLPTRQLDYVYVVKPGVEWLNLLCNGDVILHYKLDLQSPSFAENRE